MLKNRLENKKNTRKKAVEINGLLHSYMIGSESACYCTGTEASCADVDRSDCSVIVDFNLFYIGFPRSVGTSADLATVDADSVSRAHTLFTNFTLCHFLHLLVAIA